VSDALLLAAVIVLAATAAAAFRVLTRRDAMEQILAVQLLGTGGAAVLLLLSFAQGIPAILDVALVLVVLAAFSSTAFALGIDGEGRPELPAAEALAGDGAPAPAGSEPAIEPRPGAAGP
jgi:multicomponent Na+:H+ antiporter subunit F